MTNETRQKYDLIGSDGKIRKSFIKWLREKDYNMLHKSTLLRLNKFGDAQAFDFFRANYEKQLYRDEKDLDTKREIVKKNHFYYGKDKFDRLLYKAFIDS